MAAALTSSATPKLTAMRRVDSPRPRSSRPVITIPSAGDAGVTHPKPHRIMARRNAVPAGSATSEPTTRRSCAVRKRYAAASAPSAASSHVTSARSSAPIPSEKPSARESAT